MPAPKLGVAVRLKGGFLPMPSEAPLPYLAKGPANDGRRRPAQLIASVRHTLPVWRSATESEKAAFGRIRWLLHALCQREMTYSRSLDIRGLWGASVPLSPIDGQAHGQDQIIVVPFTPGLESLVGGCGYLHAEGEQFLDEHVALR